MAGKPIEGRLEDSRLLCKYGSNCYQKNPVHLAKYKHPQKRKQCRDVAQTNSKTLKPEEYSIKKKDIDKPKLLNLEHTSTSESLDNEEEDMPVSPEDVKEIIKQKFLVEMPDDFYSFWSLCESLSSNKPTEAFKEAGLVLVGPFDVLSGELKKVISRKRSLYLRHWRYYYDPPEFQTVIKGDSVKQFHIGYFRDDPNELPVFVASNCAAVDCTITPMAGNLFGAVDIYLESYKSKCDPFRKMKIVAIQKSLQCWAGKVPVDLSATTVAMRSRSRKVVTKTFHKAGLVVPVDKKTDTGYRKLIETDDKLKHILENCAQSTSERERIILLDNLQPVITAANIANDECDFGTSLELGINLFSFGDDTFHRIALQLLCTAYSLLAREEFADIVKAHLQDRRKGTSLSIIEHNT